MKKSLVLAMAMALGVTASAYAANPFSDVPAGHWAYDSISKLAAAGVIEGYGDATFGGDKLMTRYEMAQIVAKAMAKGANVDKLAAEFADELDNLGVRVANLEKKADNVKITGNVRARYVSKQGDANVDGADELTNHDATLRSRLWFNGQVNEDWTYTAMLQNNQNFTNDKENKGEEGVDFQRAYVEGKIGGVNVTAGRYNFFIADGNIYDTRADGIEVSYGKDVKVTGYVGRAADGIEVVPGEIDVTTGGNYAGLTVSGNIAKNLKLEAGYINFKDMGGDAANIHSDPDHPFLLPKIDNAIWHVGATYELGDVAVSAMYLKGDLSVDYPGVDAIVDEALDDDGYVLGVSYKGAKADVVGSWGLSAKYYDQGAQTYVAHTTDANTFGMTGFKGYGITADYTLAKNIVASVAYYDTESKLADKAGLDLDDQRIFTEVNFYF